MSEGITGNLSVQDMLLFLSIREDAMQQHRQQAALASAHPQIEVDPWDRLFAEAYAAAIADLRQFADLQAEQTSSS